ncbi:MAG: hypothetical protein EZS28_043234, partial [Streblomastix strix]
KLHIAKQSPDKDDELTTQKLRMWEFATNWS